MSCLEVLAGERLNLASSFLEAAVPLKTARQHCLVWKDAPKPYLKLLLPKMVVQATEQWKCTFLHIATLGFGLVFVK